jgi:mitotic spindle assembly checkpoint protein MAD1
MDSNKEEFRSRLPLPKTLNKQSMIRPSIGLSFIPKPTTSVKMSSTSIKTNINRNQLFGNTIGAKIIGERSGALSTVTRMRPYPIMSGRPNSGVTQVVTRLNFDNETIKTNDSLLNNLQNSPILKSCPNILRSIKQSLEKSPNIKKLLERNESKTFESKTTSPSIDWNSVTKEAELMAIKTKLAQLEDKLNESYVKNSELKVEYELKIEKLNKEITREKDKCFEFEKQIKYIQQKSDETLLQLNNAREEFSAEYDKYEKKIIDLQKRNSDLSIQLSDIQIECESVAAKHSQELVPYQQQIKFLETELNKSSQEREVLIKHIEDLISNAKDSEVLSSQLYNANIQISQLNEEIKSYKDGMKLKDILQNEIQELRKCKEENKELKKENELLSDVYSKNSILEEKLIGLESQLSKAQNQMKDSIKMDVDCDNLQTRLAEWHEVMATDSPSRVSGHINKLQKNEISLLSEMSSLKAQLNEMNSVKTQMECNLRLAQNELTDCKKKLLDQSESMKKMNRKCLLFAKEKDVYKRLITSYEHDVTLDYNKASQERITALESTLDDYRVLLEQLENELKQNKDQNCVQSNDQEINELKNEISKLRSINSQLENINKSICFESNDSYRVIHFKQNPLSHNIEQYNEEFKRLIDENRRLSTKLQLLESGSDANMTRQLDEGIKNTIEVEKLKQKLSSAEKRQQNIIDAFKKTSKEFREVCYILTGYRIDFLKQNTYRLSHIYAESPNDILLFEWDTDRTIKLLENSYSEKLKESVQTYLAQHDSFPAFLASLTLDLFRKQTHYVK